MNKSRRTVIFGAIAGLSGILTLSKTQAKQVDNAKMVIDRAEIIDAVNIIRLGADLRDWKSCRAAFADKVLTDYTSLNGGTPNKVQADTLIAGWQDFFIKTFKTTQHLITNHAVNVILNAVKYLKKVSSLKRFFATLIMTIPSYIKTILIK
ncbi:MAG: nuclear transport factor 2 family protein [Calothrix sp. FI2-JRJ7]|jgi:hypothetical protein|nr:nuclear transport factor 2 family protein [Calothrix sp. FI2-JRJ7]